MSNDTQTTEGAEVFPIETLYRGKGHAGFAIGGWTFSFSLMELDLLGRTSDPIFNGQMTLTNGSIGATVAVSHVSGAAYHFSPEVTILSFHGVGEESVHGGAKFPQPVTALFSVNTRTGHATGYIIVGRLRASATAVIKTVRV